MAALILLAFVLVVIIIGELYKKKEQEKEAARKADVDKRMAVLREIKADKERRRAVREEKEKVENISRAERKRREEAAEEERRRQEQLQWEEERRKEEEAFNKAISKLGISFVERNDYDENEGDVTYSNDAIEFSANEFLDIDKFLKFVHKNEWDESSIIMHIQSGAGASMTFFMDGYESNYRAKVGEGSVKKFPSVKALRNFVWCFCQNERLLDANQKKGNLLSSGMENASKLRSKEPVLDSYLADILMKSDYYDLFQKQVSVFSENGIALIEYELPSQDDLTWIKEYKYVTATNTVKETPLADTVIAKNYERLLYSICLRSVYEVCVAKKADVIKSIVFNGFVTALNRANGIKERKCILSLQISKERFMALDLRNVDPKKCFKSLKGVSASNLIDISPVQPIMTFNKKDSRFVDGKDVQMNSGTNLASMDWEDFEHLVRELFEMEFSKNGGEVHVTQASRDGGVDAIVFDPDPLRGGKIVIQAKRYTNTVGVSAVRDLYGTVINEGANSGILITTSDYGHDSYEFAKDKPLKLLNGGHLLALLHKNGKEGYINIQEAKEALKEK